MLLRFFNFGNCNSLHCTNFVWQYFNHLFALEWKPSTLVSPFNSVLKFYSFVLIHFSILTSSSQLFGSKYLRLCTSEKPTNIRKETQKCPEVVSNPRPSDPLPGTLLTELPRLHTNNWKYCLFLLFPAYILTLRRKKRRRKDDFHLLHDSNF